MPDAVFIDPQYPARASALEPVRRLLNNACSDQVISNPVLIAIFIERCDDHTGPKRNLIPVFVRTGIAMREAKNREALKQAVEIRT
jgi:hypothetical protein